MDTPDSGLEGMAEQEKLRLLELLLNDFHARGLLSRDTLLQVASDVVLLNYQEDEDLLCFNCMDHETEEE